MKRKEIPYKKVSSDGSITPESFSFNFIVVNAGGVDHRRLINERQF